MKEKKNCANGECASLKSSWLNELDKDQRSSVLEDTITLKLKKGQDLFEQDEKAQGFFCLRKGNVKLALNAPSGDSMTIHVYSDHGMLGHHCMISPTNFYTATCMTDVELCFISKSVMRKVKLVNTSFETKLLDKIGTEYGRLNEIIATLRTKSVLQRTTEVLARLHAQFGNDDEGAINFYVSKEELANIVGSSVESVFRSLATLKKKKCIDFERSKIWIRNEAKLHEIARLKGQRLNECHK